MASVWGGGRPGRHTAGGSSSGGSHRPAASLLHVRSVSCEVCQTSCLAATFSSSPVSLLSLRCLHAEAIPRAQQQGPVGHEAGGGSVTWECSGSPKTSPSLMERPGTLNTVPAAPAGSSRRWGWQEVGGVSVQVRDLAWALSQSAGRQLGARVHALAGHPNAHLKHQPWICIV